MLIGVGQGPLRFFYLISKGLDSRVTFLKKIVSIFRLHQCHNLLLTVYLTHDFNGRTMIMLVCDGVRTFARLHTFSGLHN